MPSLFFFRVFVELSVDWYVNDQAIQLSPQPKLAEKVKAVGEHLLRYKRPDVEEYLIEILDVLGFNHGPAHTEMIMSRSGPMLVEINARMPGGAVPGLLGAALGMNLYEAWVAVQCGALPVFEKASKATYASMKWYVNEVTGTFRSCKWPEPTPSHVVRFDVVPRTGGKLYRWNDNRDRIAYAIATGANPESAMRNAATFLDSTEFVVEPMV